MDKDERLVTAAELTDKAVEVASRLKSGSWESAQTLALLSIAKSLEVIAEAAADRPFGRA